MKYYANATDKACALVRLRPEEENAFRVAVLNAYHGHDITMLETWKTAGALTLAAAGKIIRADRMESGKSWGRITLADKLAFIKLVAMFEHIEATHRIMGDWNDENGSASGPGASVDSPGSE